MKVQITRATATAGALLAMMTVMIRILPMADVIPPSVKTAAASAKARPHRRMVVFMIDGLAQRNAVRFMPQLRERMKTTAAGIGIANFPTITPPGLRSIFSGHRSIPRPEFPGGVDPGSEEDSVFSRASASGLKTYVAGQFNWEPIYRGHGAVIWTIPFHGIRVKFAHNSRELESNLDKQILSAAEPVIRGRFGPWDLLVLHLFTADPIGHALGTEDSVYAQHLRWVDEHVTALSQRLEREAPTTFLLIGDHGMTPAGTHGGMTSIEREVPFVLWGADVVRRRLGKLQQFNAAPTICAVLGVGMPSGAEGTPVLSGFDYSADRRVAIWLDVLAQRIEHWRAVHGILPWMSGDPDAFRAHVMRLASEGRTTDAAKLAENYVRQIDSEIDDALPEKWFGRVAAALWLMVLAAVLSAMWSTTGRWDRSTVVAACVAALALVPAAVLPSLWPESSRLLVLAAAAAAAFAMLAGLGNDTGRGWGTWAVYWPALILLCVPEFVDLPYWAVAVTGAAIAVAATRHERRTWRLAVAAALWAAATAFAVAPGAPDVSLARDLLSTPIAGFGASWIWIGVEVIAGFAPAVFAWVRPRPGGTRLERSLTTLLLALPGVSAGVREYSGSPSAGIVWAACFFSFAGVITFSMSNRRRRAWVALIGLVVFRTLAGDQETAVLALTTAAAWAAAPDEEEHPVWSGLCAVAFALWAYTLIGGRPRAPQISVEEGNRILGGWHPLALTTLMAAKHAISVTLPLLGRLGARPVKKALEAVLPLGAMAAGALSMLWWFRFVEGQKMTGQTAFIGFTSAVVIAWVVVLGAVALNAVERAIALLHRRRPTIAG